MDDKKLDHISVIRENGTVYKVTKNATGDIVGIIENPMSRRVITETEANLRIVAAYRDRKADKLAGKWFFAQCETKIINNTKTLLADIQAIKKSHDILLDAPEIT